jgi:hypothetical protein
MNSRREEKKPNGPSDVRCLRVESKRSSNALDKHWKAAAHVDSIAYEDA